MSTTNRDWERVKRIGLYPEIKTQDQYERSIMNGCDEAVKFLREAKLINPSPVHIQSAHLIAFGGVHPWSGTFRQVEVSAGSLLCTHPSEIANELSYLKSASKTVFSDADPARRLLGIAFYHANFEQIHPFLDGNGRIGRAIATAQLQLSFGPERQLSMPRDDYMAGLKHAHRTQDYRALALTLGSGIGLNPERMKLAIENIGMEHGHSL